MVRDIFLKKTKFEINRMQSASRILVGHLNSRATLRALSSTVLDRAAGVGHMLPVTTQR